MSYRVFARKYRPQTFEEVVGQDHITRTLRNAIQQDRLAQAYLFVGPRGIGKTSSARILAKALNCEKGVTPDPCGTCNSCVEIAEGRSLDVMEIDGASNNNVDNIRELRENVAYAPARGPFKIYLIDEVHMLSAGAFNALLKTLEEPPPHVKFLFATTEAQKVPATITSRCQRFDLQPIPADLIAAHLLHIAGKESIALEEEAAAALARGADGGLRDAESMLDQVVAFCGTTVNAADVLEVFGFTSREVLAELVAKLLAADAAGVLEILSAQAGAGKDLPRLLADLTAWLRDLLLFQIHPAATPSHPAMANQAESIPREKLLELLDHFTEWDGRMRWATDKKLQMEVALIKAVHLLGQTSLSEAIEALAGIGGDTPPSPPKHAASSTQAKPTARPRPQPQSEPSATTSTRSEQKTSPSPPPAADTPSPPAAADPGDPGAIWREVAAELSTEAPFKFGWLDTGEFLSAAGDVIHIRFPESQRDNVDSIIWTETLEVVLNDRLAKRFGAAAKFSCEFVPDAESPAGANPREEEISQPQAESEPAEPAPEPPPAPPADPMEDFKNDPLIRKALDYFEAEILTSKTS